MKRISIVAICILLLLTSCTPKLKEDEVVQNEKTKQKQSIIPSYQLSKDNYRMVLPYRPSKARGVITNQLANRVDIDEMEEGLRRHSKEYFDPETYYFQEGQYLTEDMVYSWLKRKLTKEELEKQVQAEVNRLKKEKMTVDEKKIREKLQSGLNPAIKDESSKKQHENNPRYLSHILEQNYLVKKDDKNTTQLAGVSLGIALKSVYRYQTEIGGPYYYEKISNKEMLEQGNKLAQTILKRVRKIQGLENVPIMIALYREEDQSSPVPGHFVAKTLVDKGEIEIGKWESIKEEHVLFPSDRANKAFFDDAQVVKAFTDEIAKYFPNYVGVIGEGFYVNEELRSLTITIPIEFYGKGEVLGFTQYAYRVVKEVFSDHYDLELNIKSNEKNESLIYREAGAKEPIVHIYH